MKSKLRLLATLALCLAAVPSCTPLDGTSADPSAEQWPGSPNPLDSPVDVPVRTPLAEGRFGHSNKGRTW